MQNTTSKPEDKFFRINGKIIHPAKIEMNIRQIKKECLNFFNKTIDKNIQELDRLEYNKSSSDKISTFLLNAKQRHIHHLKKMKSLDKLEHLKGMGHIKSEINQ